MRTFWRLVLSASIILISPAVHSQTAGNAPSCCSIVERALKDANTLKPGMKRSDVEKLFVQAGGITFPNQTAYVYKDCRLIGLEVTFDLNLNVAHSFPFAPTDIIKSVSRLKIDYEAMDEIRRPQNSYSHTVVWRTSHQHGVFPPCGKIDRLQLIPTSPI